MRQAAGPVKKPILPTAAVPGTGTTREISKDRRDVSAQLKLAGTPFTGFISLFCHIRVFDRPAGYGFFRHRHTPARQFLFYRSLIYSNSSNDGLLNPT
jgi:hypothetical protein